MQLTVISRGFANLLAVIFRLLQPAAWSVVRIERIRPAASSGIALPMGAFAVPSPGNNCQVGEKSLHAASLLCPVWVARISRLIGNPDTTTCCARWQVIRVARGP